MNRAAPAAGRRPALRGGVEGAEIPVGPTRNRLWSLVEEGFDLAREHEIEALFAISNGYVGVRASLSERTPLSAPATVLAGVYDRPAGSGSVPALLPVPDWTRFDIRVDGNPLRLGDGVALEHRRTLDIRKGIYWREWRHRDPDGRVTRLRVLRAASLADRHLLLQRLEITPHNYGGQVCVESRIPDPDPEASPALGPAPVVLEHGALDDGTGPALFALRAPVAGHVVALSAVGTLQSDGDEPVRPTLEVGDDWLVQRWVKNVDIGTTCRIDRLIVIHTSRDGERPIDSARFHIARTAEFGMARLLFHHTERWKQRWKVSDVVVRGDDHAQRALRFASYHLIGAANPEDERVSIGARMLTGTAYKGHVFWDTEIYMLPFFVFTHPPSARALLMYRYHTLPAAREKAAASGWRGALYAWESTDTGEETTPPLALAPDGTVVRTRSGELEHHISSAVAFGVWQYWTATRDDEFFAHAGVEMLVETARFWASRGAVEPDGLYHIRHVIGPDEYHEDVDDSAYTNVMAQWNLERAAEAADWLSRYRPERWRALTDALGLTTDEPESWRDLAARMYTGYDPRTKLFEQFHGYFGLEEVDLAAFTPRAAPMEMLLGHEAIARTQVIKQADVVLLLHLLGDRFSPAVREANFRFYEPRCGHGSSLSPSVHALVAARLGDMETADRYFRQSAEIDLADNMGNAAGGVHAAALGGLWQAAVFGFGGLRLDERGPSLDPRLPPAWRELRFPITWRGRTRRLRAGPRHAEPARP